MALSMFKNLVTFEVGDLMMKGRMKKELCVDIYIHYVR